MCILVSKDFFMFIALFMVYDNFKGGEFLSNDTF